MVNQDKQIGGEPVHIRDCYVWAEIYYLDSKTDYREYLPEPSPLAPRKRTRHAGLVEGVAQSQLYRELGGSTRRRCPLRTVHVSRALLVGETRIPTDARPSPRAIARRHTASMSHRVLTKKGAGDRGLREGIKVMAAG